MKMGSASHVVRDSPSAERDTLWCNGMTTCPAVVGMLWVTANFAFEL